MITDKGKTSKQNQTTSTMSRIVESENNMKKIITTTQATGKNYDFDSNQVIEEKINLVGVVKLSTLEKKYQKVDDYQVVSKQYDIPEALLLELIEQHNIVGTDVPTPTRTKKDTI